MRIIFCCCIKNPASATGHRALFSLVLGPLSYEQILFLKLATIAEIKSLTLLRKDLDLSSYPNMIE